MGKTGLLLAFLVLATSNSMAQRSESKRPKLVQATPASYPEDVGSSGVEGNCTLSLVVAADGTPSKYRIVHSMGGAFDAAALQAVSQSHFEPGRLSRKPVAMDIYVWIPFHADKSPAIPEMLPLKHLDHTAILINSVDPNEPDRGRKAKYQGVVVVSVLVTEDGKPDSPRVVRALGLGLDEKAIEAVKRYRFKPAIKDGRNVPSLVNVIVDVRIY